MARKAKITMKEPKPFFFFLPETSFHLASFTFSVTLIPETQFFKLQNHENNNVHPIGLLHRLKETHA